MVLGFFRRSALPDTTACWLSRQPHTGVDWILDKLGYYKPANTGKRSTATHGQIILDPGAFYYSGKPRKP